MVAPHETAPCSRCGGQAERLWSGVASSVHQDTIEGGQVFENGFETPQIFYSHSAHRAALAARGCEIAAKWVPGDKHLTRWDVPDAKTLENAAVLLTRGTQPREPEFEPAPITVTDGETFRYGVEQ